MPDQFLHGVEVIELDYGARPISTVRSSVIGLIGTAPDAQSQSSANLTVGAVASNAALTFTAKVAGSLTSQLFANVYLHELDELVKYDLREKNYVRYMDDFVIVHHDKTHLHHVRATIEQFLWERLRLKTNAKTQVFPVGNRYGRALEFLGYRIWMTHRRIRKSSISRITRTLKRLGKQYVTGKISLSKIRESVTSWIAHASHAQSYGLRRKLLGSIPFRRGDER